ncbi:MAG: hypothetical protein C0616_14130 [Desulfuromonas sp.]|nr:MAG: hypothetical protein C0616_14130 [Desulfuromonas sp.]
MQNRVSKEEWVAMFRDIGLDEETMRRWHRLFEQRHPQAHADFLGWLDIAPDEVARIRKL